jgi:trimeric autotransporter adhesin
VARWGPFPPTSIVNFVANEDVANASAVALGAGGAISVQSVAMTHLVIDVYGYFTDVEELEGSNTALGVSALLGNTRGFQNTAVGSQALQSNFTGFGNTATGSRALGSNTTGGNNTATGTNALFSNTTGFQNTAVGSQALQSNTTGFSNTATGTNALFSNTTGSNNTALGINAGLNVTTGNDNIHIGNRGADTDTGLIRIGTAQTATFISGIRGVTPGAADAVAVLIDSNGQLGTTNSSRRVKTDIHDLGDDSRALHQLRPVSFRYRAHPHTTSPQYGLIAEEVAEIYPELVVRDTDGQPAGVKYHVLPAMLLNELQRQQREFEAEKARTATSLAAQQLQLATQHDQLAATHSQLTVQQEEIAELRAQVRALLSIKAATKD